MGIDFYLVLGLKEKLLLAIAAAIAIFASVTFGVVSGAQTSSTQSTALPEWQTKAGGKLSFAVASIRPSKPGTFRPPNFELGPGDSYHPTGGELLADFPLEIYIQFAYSLWLTPEQRDALFANFPNWTKTDSFTINARGPVDSTKDQMRLMMQSLLADRFELKIHYEIRETPVLVMTLVRPGKLGPKLHPHSEGPPCDKVIPAREPETVPSVFPLNCEEVGTFFDGKHPAMLGARDTTLDSIAQALPSFGDLGRPIVNRTGLIGRYDFTLAWAYNPGGTLPPDSGPLQAPNFLEALKEQLGMKLEPAKLPLQVLVVDHVERPSEN
jgi:bla regulator protein blaR1